jgi:hypothetical protein
VIELNDLIQRKKMFNKCCLFLTVGMGKMEPLDYCKCIGYIFRGLG